jgi:hypothetical protein
MRKADLLFMVSITVMSCIMMYAIWTKNIYLFAIGELGCIADIIAYWRYNR